MTNEQLADLLTQFADLLDIKRAEREAARLDATTWHAYP
jgi:hypothetical protein